MRARQAAGDRKSDPAAGSLGVVLFVPRGHAFESCEDPLQVGCGNTTTGVADLDRDRTLGDAGGDGDAATGWGSRQGVAQEVRQDLADSVRVNVGGGWAGRGAAQLDAGPGELRTQPARHVVCKRCDVGALAV